MRILVDMDGVLADFESRFLEIWRAKYPDKAFFRREERRTPYLIDQYPPEYRDLILQIYLSPGFFRSLPPVPGGLKAINEIREAGIEVFICTTPFVQYRNCVVEKFEWVENHLGKEWIERIILTFDKTLILGDYLIDDMPTVAGSEKPTWKHIIYDSPQNASAKTEKRITWDNWKEVMLSDEEFRQAYGKDV